MASIRKKAYKRKNPRTGRVEKRTTRKYYIRFKDASGVTKEVPGYTDRAATMELARKLERRAAQESEGLIDPFEEHRRRSLVEHLKEFESHLRNKGCTEMHVGIVAARARKVVKGCKFKRMGDISASHVESYLAELRAKGLSIQTVNFYLQAVKQFCRWLVADRRRGDNPLAHLQGGNVKLDRRRDRRELNDEEIGKLISAARCGPVRHGLNGHDRFVLYATALGTGLRAGELASLTPASLDLDSDLPTVRVVANYAKNRREDVIPIPRDLADLLRGWISEKNSTARRTIHLRGKDANASDRGTDEANGRLWLGAWATARKAGAMMKADLMAAGIAFKTDEGQADFHALRHTYLSRLGRSGASPKAMQRLARHASVELTLGRYTHASLYDLGGAVAALPPLPTEPQEEAAEGTGTDGQPFPLQFPLERDLEGHGMATGGNATFVEARGRETPQPIDHSEFGDDCHDMSSKERRGRDSNPRRRLSPLSGLANQRFRPLSHLSGFAHVRPAHVRGTSGCA